MTLTAESRATWFDYTLVPKMGTSGIRSEKKFESRARIVGGGGRSWRTPIGRQAEEFKEAEVAEHLELLADFVANAALAGVKGKAASSRRIP